ncbi:D-alanyl-D-alanine carboxypeptidase/D-alanyl-D-alanine-endopeptidase [Natronosporangium hydrolyticum]|uniref:D-alanyl-D-alanine carboxypeptidase/D-alanyl-D-alanine-endopeptidase n=1 Tax=Natronosporangium hydrolyticum TaxID=2811111 RepID=A0A895YIW9_9ACTN|nr:D-alanyl-D-alanine carboxypeptidase/D-alanyl-D-alanine-endopeptidase [Natronosporangium hydrolyticum]QSB14536.1 D-alanyl-D-alanine carboxypeptidase/D-alanyl-D-alanine-endopeptidase [Natronosporangium hydrolyticum]
MGKKTAWAATIVGGSLVALVAAALVVRPWEVPEPVATPTPTPEPPPAAVLTGADAGAPAPTADGVRDAIDELVEAAAFGGAISASVVDVGTGEQLYSYEGATPTIPASTTKLLTGAAVLAAHGPAHQLATVAVAGAEPGEVVLVGGGDPTLAIDADGFFPGAARLDQLAEQVTEALGDTQVSQVTVDSSLFTGPVHGPWDDDIPGSGFVGPITALMTDGGRIDPDPAQGQRSSLRWEEPDLAAGVAFAELLGVSADQVTIGSAPPAVAGDGDSGGQSDQGESTTDPTGTPAPPDPAAPGAVLGQVMSPPLLRLVETMLVTSDNALAEGLARQVALHQGEPASFAGAAAATTAVLAELGLPMAAAEIADGSGLSRDNQLPAELLTDLLAQAADPAAGEPLAGLFAGLPVAGWSGTLAGRYRAGEPDPTGVEAELRPAGPGAGAVRAKTGSLTGVNALAGLVMTADGRLLAFALLTEEVPVAPGPARQALDEVTTALLECGCR